MIGLIGVLLVVAISGCTSSANKEFNVGNSTFQVPGDWKQEFSTNGTGSNNGGRTVIKKDEFEVDINQYADITSYNKDYKKSTSHYSMTTSDINGTTVQTITTTRSYNTDPTLYPYYLYYFKKNSEYYSMSIAYSGTDQGTVNETATNIISSLK